MTGWIAARTKEPGSLSLRGSNVDGAHPGQGAQKEKSELGDNKFDFSAFECEVTRRHPAQREAQDWSERPGGSQLEHNAMGWLLRKSLYAMVGK